MRFKKLRFLPLLLLGGLQSFGQEITDINIDWSTTIAPVTAHHWGINDEKLSDPSNGNGVKDSRYNELFTDLEPEFIRLHHANIIDNYTDATTRWWDVEKIRSSFLAAEAYEDANVMFNIVWWPAWLASSSAPLPDEHRQEFLDLVKDLVVVLRDSVGFQVDYWELTNEREGVYEDAGKLEDLWFLIDDMIKVIKEVDPQAKVGGPALTWPNPTWVESFLDSLGHKVDFVTWHNYGSAPPPNSVSDLELVNSVVNQIDGNIGNVMSALSSRSLTPKTFLTEFNVQWVWQPFEPRHANNVGAMFQAAIVRRTIINGMDGSNVWHFKGNAYGMIDVNNELRSPYYLYLWGHKYLIGDLVDWQHTSATNLEVIPVKQQGGLKSVLVLNKREEEIKIGDLSAMLESSQSDFTVVSIASHTRSPFPPVSANGTYTLPPMSLTLITEALSSDSEPPSIPVFTDTVTTQTTIRLNWSAAQDNVSVKGYKFYLNGDFHANQEADNSRNIVFDNLDDNTSYKIGISAYDSAGNESGIYEVDIITQVDQESPTIPQNFAVVDMGSTLDLTWTASTDNIGVENYNIYLDDAKIGETKNLFFFYFDPEAGRTYDFAVAAIDATGNESEKAFASLSLVTSIDDESQSSLKIFPNPSSGEIQIHLNTFKENISLRLLDTSGKNVAYTVEKLENGFFLQLDKSLTPAIYIIELLDGNEVIGSRRIIVNNQ
ncbi:MAG: T9SS type A sorting domain-containing protein [Bacteroidota bacterium]